MEPVAPSQKRIAVIGGGAAGFFAAITAAEANPAARVVLYERGKHFLAKVKISGGGRCNVTHNCFDPARLASHYPRGARELRGAFHRWQPRDMIEWFAARGVKLKAEADGRMFPVTDDSQTIIDCFMQAAREAGVRLIPSVGLKNLEAAEGGNQFSLELTDNTRIEVDAICLAAGSLKASPLTRSIEKLGHTVETLAPSLFAMNVADKRTHGLAGLSVQQARVHALPQSRAQTGPVLITHRGFSGPAILRLSAWEARSFQEQNYHFELSINWLGDLSDNQVREYFTKLRQHSGKTAVKTKVFETLPRRLWERLVEAADIAPETSWAQLPKDKETALVCQLIDGRFHVQGKTTNKDEFVTAGGVRLKEVDFRNMQSKQMPGLYFAGECLDIDGITGGFNFQAAWTTGRLAGLAMAESAIQTS